VEFGFIKSLTRKGRGFEMRFDPAWFLSGKTANVAAAEDGVVKPGQPVPNDNYTLDEGHRLLTYKVPANAQVTASVVDDGSLKLTGTVRSEADRSKAEQIAKESTNKRVDNQIQVKSGSTWDEKPKK